MKSFEALQHAINGKTVDHARKLGLSTSLVNKWQEPSIDWSDSGAYNPLDRIETIIETSLSAGVPADDAFAPLHYLANRFGGVFVPVPKEARCLSELSRELLLTVKQFGDLANCSASVLEDGVLTKREAEVIEEKGWQAVKQICSYLSGVKDCIR